MAADAALTECPRNPVRRSDRVAFPAMTTATWQYSDNEPFDTPESKGTPECRLAASEWLARGWLSPAFRSGGGLCAPPSASSAEADEYFAERERHGLRTPARTPSDFVRRGSLYDPNGGSSCSSSWSATTGSTPSSPSEAATPGRGRCGPRAWGSSCSPVLPLPQQPKSWCDPTAEPPDVLAACEGATPGGGPHAGGAQAGCRSPLEALNANLPSMPALQMQPQAGAAASTVFFPPVALPFCAGIEIDTGSHRYAQTGHVASTSRHCRRPRVDERGCYVGPPASPAHVGGVARQLDFGGVELPEHSSGPLSLHVFG
mmetsp:Transcript_13530/g.36532  ORF Transcript_13530/g.36532 Transcript_13530/m.36532 type:complete len:316 (-) Transcript_13530:289-1236(-)